MSWLLLVLAAAALALFERFWAPYALKSLHFKGESSHVMAEPGETVTWRGTVENRGRLPIPFVRLTESFPVQAQALAEQMWIDSHCTRSVSQWFVEEKISVGPRRSCSRTVKFSFRQRGLYQIGAYRLAAGDLLGFREASKSGDWQHVVVIPERSRQKAAIDALGGFLGDVSVRRFILEDPILTLGFRDYTGREPMKSISWTRTAAAGSLQVKQYDHTAEQHVLVLLNTEGASADELEECFRLTRSVCEKLEEKKIPYSFRTNGNLPGPVGKVFWLAEGLGQRHLNTVLYGLGRGDGTCFYSFRYLTQRTLLHRKSNESYIVITPPLTEKSAPSIKKMEAAVGSGICVLIGKAEVTEQ